MTATLATSLRCAANDLFYVIPENCFQQIRFVLSNYNKMVKDDVKLAGADVPHTR